MNKRNQIDLVAERKKDFADLALWDIISMCHKHGVAPRDLYGALPRCKTAVGKSYSPTPYRHKALFNSLGFNHETIRNIFGRTFPQHIAPTLAEMTSGGTLLCITNGSTYNRKSCTRSFFCKRYLPPLEQVEAVYLDESKRAAVLSCEGMSAHARKWVARICKQRKEEAERRRAAQEETPAAA